MTVKELSQLHYLKQEVKELKEKIYRLQLAATDTSVRVSDTSHGSGATDKVGKLVAEIDYYKMQLNERLKACQCELIKLEKYISDCDDSFIRQILVYRFVDGLRWNQVVDKLGAASEYSIKKALYRYIRKN